ncbi:MAG TPA: recombination regulator RecX [Lactobacillus sp.]|nr:recombination regulator RecX [Lactobacillus sp.]
MAKKITAIATQKKAGRFNIYLDGKYAFSVSEDVLIKYRLAKGLELDEEMIEHLQQADLLSKAYNKALDHLSYQLRTKKEIKIYLTKLEVPENDQNQIISKLVELNLLDDLAYAKSYVRTAANTTDKGPFVIAQKLKQKGVAEEFINEALIEFSFEQQVQTALKLAEKFVAKNKKLAFQALKNKLYQHLVTKGFSSETISLVLEELALKKDDTLQLEALREQGAKLLRRYQRYPQPECFFKLKQALYRKGFSLSEIERYLAEITAE